MKLTDLVFPVLLATAAIGHGQTHPAGPAARALATPSTAAALASAEVLSVYPEERRVLLRHGPIPGLGMSAMTMEFGLAAPGMLKGLRKGARVRFAAVQEAGDYVITRIDVLK